MSRDEIDSLNAIGHLCFECKYKISADDVRTVTYMGNMPVYYHSSCLVGEDKTQAIVEWALMTGNQFYKETAPKQKES